MNYNNFIGYFFLLLIVAYEGRNEDLEVLKEEVRSIRKEAALMRKELVLAREARAGIKEIVAPVKKAAETNDKHKTEQVAPAH